MHFLTVARCRLLQLVDRAFDAMPDCAPFHVTKGQQRVGAVGRV